MLQIFRMAVVPILLIGLACSIFGILVCVDCTKKPKKIKSRRDQIEKKKKRSLTISSGEVKLNVDIQAARYFNQKLDTPSTTMDSGYCEEFCDKDGTNHMDDNKAFPSCFIKKDLQTYDKLTSREENSKCMQKSKDNYHHIIAANNHSIHVIFNGSVETMTSSNVNDETNDIYSLSSDIQQVIHNVKHSEDVKENRMYNRLATNGIRDENYDKSTEYLEDNYHHIYIGDDQNIHVICNGEKKSIVSMQKTQQGNKYCSKNQTLYDDENIDRDICSTCSNNQKFMSDNGSIITDEDIYSTCLNNQKIMPVDGQLDYDMISSCPNNQTKYKIKNEDENYSSIYSQTIKTIADDIWESHEVKDPNNIYSLASALVTRKFSPKQLHINDNHFNEIKAKPNLNQGQFLFGNNEENESDRKNEKEKQEKIDSNITGFSFKGLLKAIQDVKSEEEFNSTIINEDEFYELKEFTNDQKLHALNSKTTIEIKNKSTDLSNSCTETLPDLKEIHHALSERPKQSRSSKSCQYSRDCTYANSITDVPDQINDGTSCNFNTQWGIHEDNLNAKTEDEVYANSVQMDSPQTSFVTLRNRVHSDIPHLESPKPICYSLKQEKQAKINSQWSHSRNNPYDKKCDNGTEKELPQTTLLSICSLQSHSGEINGDIHTGPQDYHTYQNHFVQRAEQTKIGQAQDQVLMNSGTRQRNCFTYNHDNIERTPSSNLEEKPKPSFSLHCDQYSLEFIKVENIENIAADILTNEDDQENSKHSDSQEIIYHNQAHDGEENIYANQNFVYKKTLHVLHDNCRKGDLEIPEGQKQVKRQKVSRNFLNDRNEEKEIYQNIADMKTILHGDFYEDDIYANYVPICKTNTEDNNINYPNKNFALTLPEPSSQQFSFHNKFFTNEEHNFEIKTNPSAPNRNKLIERQSSYQSFPSAAPFKDDIQDENVVEEFYMNSNPTAEVMSGLQDAMK